MSSPRIIVKVAIFNGADCGAGRLDSDYDDEDEEDENEDGNYNNYFGDEDDCDNDDGGGDNGNIIIDYSDDEKNWKRWSLRKPRKCCKEALIRLGLKGDKNEDNLK